MSSEGDREAADVWSRGPQREVRWLPPTAKDDPPDAGRPAFERTDGALRVVLYVFAAIVVVNVVAIVSNGFEINLANQMLHGGGATTAERDNNDMRQGVVAAVQTLLLVAGAFVWIAWFHTSYGNVEAVGGERRYGTGWAIGAWFVPFLSLWRPKQIANDLWRAGGEPSAPPPLMLWWWLTWILSNSLGYAAIRYSGDGATDRRAAATAEVIGSALSGVAAVLAIAVAIRITERLAARS